MRNCAVTHVRHLLASLALIFGAGCLHLAPVNPQAVAREKARCVDSLQHGDLPEADRACSLGIEYSPEDADLWTDLGLLRTAQRRKHDARECFVKAIHCNPDEYQAFNSLGMLELEDGSLTSAERDFKAALKILPDFIDARHNLALLYWKQKRTAQAEETLHMLLHIHPEYAQAHDMLCAMALEEQKPRVAVSECSRAVELSASDTTGWANLGAALFQVGQFAEAAKAFRECLALDDSLTACSSGLQSANRSGAER